MRPTDLLLAVAVVGGAIWTYDIKRDAEDAADRVSDLARQIRAEEERIVFLRADWAYLNAPARLEKLVERYAKELKLAPVEAHQWVEPYDLPEADELDEPDTLEAGAAPLVTGSISGVPRPRPGRAFSIGERVAPSRERRASIPTSIDDLLRNR